MNQTWYFKKSEIVQSQTIRLSKIECEAMIESHRCNDQPMICDNEKCFYKGSFRLTDYYWNQDKSDEYYDCQFNKIKILTDNTETQIFKSVSGECKAFSLYCQLYDSIVIWNNSIIDTCGLNIIHSGYNYSFKNNIVYSKKENLLFQLKNYIIKCNIRIFPTTDNLFISFTNDPYNQISIQKISKKNQKIKQRDINNLMLAELDYDRIELWDEMNNLNKEDKLRDCQIFSNQLTIFAKFENELNEIIDPTGKHLTIYTKQNSIFKTDCMKIDKIQIKTKINICYNDIEIIILNKNSTSTAFLSINKILRLDSSQISCKNLKRSIIFNNLNKILIQNENKIAIHDLETLNELQLEESIIHKNMEIKHINEITNGFDFEEITNVKIENTNDIEGGYSILPNDKIKTTNDLLEDLNFAKNKIANTIESIENNFQYAKNSIKIIIFTIASTTLIIIITCIIENVKNKKKKQLHEYMELKRMFQKTNEALGQC
jgi:hypothetical protein